MLAVPNGFRLTFDQVRMTDQLAYSMMGSRIASMNGPLLGQTLGGSKARERL